MFQMQTKYIVSAVVLLATSCGGKNPSVPPPIVPTKPAVAPKSEMQKQVELLPKDTTFVAGVAVEKVLATPVAKRILALWKSTEEGTVSFRSFSVLEQVCGFSPLEDIRWGLLVLGPEDPDESHALIVEGNFDKAQVNACAVKMGMEVAETGDVTIVDEAFNLAWISEHRVAVSIEEDSIAFLLSVANGTQTPKWSDNFREAVDSVDASASLWAAGNLSDEDYSVYEALGFYEVSDTTPAVGYGSAMIGDGIALAATIRFANSLDAQSHVNAWRTILPHFYEGMLGYYLRSIDVSQVRDEARASLFIDEKNTKSGLAMLENVLEEQRRDALAWKEREEREAKADTDRDGIVNAKDRCPLKPEDFNQFEDTDGCPDASKKIEQEKRKRTMEAIRAGTITKMTKTKAQPHSDQGWAYLNAGVYDKAVEEFQIAYKFYPHEAFLYNIAYSYDGMKKREKDALEYYKKYLVASPNGENAEISRQRVAKLVKKLRRRSR